MTYLVELHLLETAISLLLILHVEDLDQLECHHPLVLYPLGFEHIGELPLAD